MVLPITPINAQRRLSEHLRERRLAAGLTQEGLSLRSGVSLPTLRKFEQKGLISLASYLKLVMIVGGLDELVSATAPPAAEFSSIDEVINAASKPKPKRGRRT
jgi:transcriptional regulator with XRE-family HTH domain